MTGGYTISTDKTKLDVTLIHQFLSQESYWAANIPREIVERSIKGSLCFGVYLDGQQVGFARVITDEATFAYLADVFILSEHRGKGLSKQLMETISAWPTLQGLRRWILATRDAHTLYEQFGFKVLDTPEIFMHKKLIETY
ncbi:GCN5-related N-acetyltransferase [Fibrisoma limi BUZ 3]|uniref:GCN5-related N-acetyltransferase n=1 Tax=Fibrisoma limi BUZ 3 TaxID=1185876 RepID=I2GRR2_9BACT|nr:GNAT family N-acetyltransferase [Fibrisoma limi]CCH56590.1 GCN5-related N-acetyltransferase [Fibrisoma limi BUZ 3]